jgi:hypothetical protein
MGFSGSCEFRIQADRCGSAGLAKRVDAIEHPELDLGGITAGNPVNLGQRFPVRSESGFGCRARGERKKRGECDEKAQHLSLYVICSRQPYSQVARGSNQIGKHTLL